MATRKKIVKIEPLGFKLDIKSESDYNVARAKYIDEYESYDAGGFLAAGGYRKHPDLGEASWNGMYPNGHSTWTAYNSATLNASGENLLITKIDELVDAYNKLVKQMNESKS